MMKIRISCLFICITMLIPLLGIFALAETKEYDAADNDCTEYPGLVSGEQGLVYNPDFSKYIDVPLYYDEISNSGYDELQVVGVNEYYTEDEMCLIMYLYNPMLEEISGSPYPIGGTGEYSEEYVCIGRIQYVSQFTGEPGYLDMRIPMEEWNMYCERNFYFLTVYLYIDGPEQDVEYSRGDFVFNDTRVYSFLEYEFCVFFSASEGEMNANTTDHDLLSRHFLNKTFTFTGVNDKKECTISDTSFVPYTQPDWDLQMFQDLTFEEINEKYPIQDDSKDHDASLVYAYEEALGDDKYHLYLYVYDPEKRSSTSLEAYLFDQDEKVYKKHSFSYVSSSKTLTKFKATIDSQGYYRDELNNYNVRDYYIHNLYVSYKTGNTTGKYTIESETHFRFSDTSFENLGKKQFVYKCASPFTLEGDFQVGDIVQVTFNDDRLQEFEVIDYTNFTANLVNDYVELTITKLSDTLYLQYFTAYADFPLFGSFEIECSYLHYRSNDNSDTGESTTDSSVAYTILQEGLSSLEVKYSNLIFPAVTYASSDEEPGLYMSINQDTVLDIEAAPTYYRLNSSSKGENYYQTLTSIYFSIPESLLSADLSHGFFGNGYVSEIELQYSSAMLQPGLIVKKEIYDLGDYIENPGKYEDTAEHNARRIQAGIYNSHGSAFISNRIITSVNYQFWSDFMCGIKPAGIFGSSGENCYAYETIPYFLIYDGEWKDYDELYSSDEMLKIVSQDLKLFEDLKYYHDTISFNQKMKLESFLELNFFEQANEIGLGKALSILFKFDNEFDKSKTFKAIETLRPSQLVQVLQLSDEELSSKYAVSLGDVPAVRAKMQSCIEKGEAFVFLRFDVHDYYCSKPEYLYSDTAFQMAHKDVADTSYIFQTKYYKGIEILAMEISDWMGHEKIYEVNMDPIDFVPGITAQPPAGDLVDDIITIITDPERNDGKTNSLRVIAGLIIFAIVVVVLAILFPGVMMPILSGAINIIGAGLGFVLNIGGKFFGAVFDGIGRAFSAVLDFFKRE